MLDYKKTISKLYANINDNPVKGEQASYIPELSNVDSNKFGVFINPINQENFGIGNFNEKFSIQSISKALTLTMVFRELNDKLWHRVNVEPSGNPFNSLVQLEADNGIPRNPFINAGALVVCDILLSLYKNPKEEFLNFTRGLARNNSIDFSTEVYLSEKETGFRNIALCNFIKSFNNIINEPDDVLDLYFTICSLEMTCEELSNTFYFFANDGKTCTGEKVMSESKTKRVNAIMQTCGFYDQSGDFAFRVGLPGKSGVGGGIIAIHPHHFTIATWSPLLNRYGNSIKGMQFLEQFTTETHLSIF